MDNKAKYIFENNPKLKALYKVKGESVYFTKKEGADAYAKEKKATLETINRPTDEEEDEKVTEEVVLPEGTPNKEGWTIPQIQKWLSDRDVKFASNAKEDNLLGKVDEYLKAQEAADNKPE